MRRYEKNKSTQWERQKEKIGCAIHFGICRHGCGAGFRGDGVVYVCPISAGFLFTVK